MGLCGQTTGKIGIGGDNDDGLGIDMILAMVAA
jgi:hypothetical protein